jgi:hypothetical protein
VISSVLVLHGEDATKPGVGPDQFVIDPGDQEVRTSVENGRR